MWKGSGHQSTAAIETLIMSGIHIYFYMQLDKLGKIENNTDKEKVMRPHLVGAMNII